MPAGRPDDHHADRAVVFACSDPQPDIEGLFTGAQVYTVRTAGLAIGPSVLGSLEYAIAHMDTPLLIILGHNTCRLPGSTPDTRIRRAATALRDRSTLIAHAVATHRCALIGLCRQDDTGLLRPVTLDLQASSGG
jgi:carbonic anhydrase